MAYTQKFGRPSLGGNGETFAEKGLITPTDPVKPFKPVAGEFNEELDEITITASGNKPATEPSNRQLSAERRKQIKAGKGPLLKKDESYNENPNITQTTSMVDKVGADGETYPMTQNTFTNPLGGQSTNVYNTPSAAFIGENTTGLFFDSNAHRTQAQNSTNYMNSPEGQKRRGSEMQNFGTEVWGGKDSGEPLTKWMVNNQTGSIVGQLSGEGTTRYLSQSRNQVPSNRIGEFKNPNSYTQLLDGHKMSNQTLLNLKPEEAMAYIRQDSLGKQQNRFTNQAKDEGILFRNNMFKKPDLTSGKKQ